MYLLLNFCPQIICHQFFYIGSNNIISKRSHMVLSNAGNPTDTVSHKSKLQPCNLYKVQVSLRMPHVHVYCLNRYSFLYTKLICFTILKTFIHLIFCPPRFASAYIRNKYAFIWWFKFIIHVRYISLMKWCLHGRYLMWI